MPLNKKALLLLKYPQAWERLFVNLLSNEFSIHVIYAEEIISTGGTKKLISVINQKIIEIGYEIIFIEVDFYPAIDFTLITKIKFLKKIIFTLDDLMFHRRNSLTAAAGNCDLILTADPLSVLKYEEKMMNAHLIFHDTIAPKYNLNEIVQKKTDVLFFGFIGKGDRSIFINYLKENGIKVKVVGGNNRMSQDELTKEIRSSKIILNLSKSSHTSDLFKFGYKDIDPFCTFLQFKLRIIEAGLLGVACVSEYTPAIALMFNQDEVPVFRNKEECLVEIQRLLGDEPLLYNYARRLNMAVNKKYESKPLMASVLSKINASNYNNIPIKVPSWYYIETLNHRIKITFRSRSVKRCLREMILFDYPGRHWYSLKNLHISLSGACQFSHLAITFIIHRVSTGVKRLKGLLLKQ